MSQVLEKDLLNGRHFLAGTLPLAPYVSYKNISINGHINDIDGFINQIVLYLAIKCQFTFGYIQSRDRSYGGFTNGSWNGLIGMLYRGDIDFIAACLTITYPRSRIIEFTIQFDDQPTSLLIPYPELDTMATIDGITRPFQYEVWILIGVSIVAVGFILRMILFFESYYMVLFQRPANINRNQISLFSSFWRLLRFQNIFYFSSRTPVRLLLASWCLVTIVLVNAYSTTLISYLMTPRYQRPMVDFVEDIVNIPRPVFMISKYTSNEASVMNADSGALLKIADSLRKYPNELRLSSHDQAVELVVKYQRTYSTHKAALLAMMEEDLKATGQCRLYLAKEPWQSSRVAFGLPKSSQFTSTFNHEIYWLHDVGLLDYWRRQYWPRPNRCSEPLTIKINHNKNSNINRVTLSYVSSAFLLLGCGLVASLTAFLIERLI